jgi:anti-repressor protein
MNDLIKVDYDSSDHPTVSGRELHKALEVKTAYKDWFPRMCEYGFTEGKDFSSFLSESTGGRPATDHALTIQMAKELCMLQRTEIGKKCRQYFIQVEEAWNRPEAVIARGLKMANRQLDIIKQENTKLLLKIEEDKPKVLFADGVSASNDAILIREMAKILKQNGIDMGEKRLFEYLREYGYLIKCNGSDYNMPTQRAMDMGLFVIKETVITHSDGHTSVRKTAKVTGKGQIYFLNHFKKTAKGEIIL